MNRILSLSACLALLAAPAAIAQGKPPGAGQGKPPASAPQQGQGTPPASAPKQEQERQQDREQDRREEQAGDDKGNNRDRNQAQQDLQKRCQDGAHERGLQGDEHGRFMQECMGNVPDSKGSGGKPEQTPRR